ncbi:ATP-binding protein [Oceanisphaera sp.]|uniref:ATP-binding protein n=1 Tax=Oceanisphaera sp. TaxID=1929979 RepID=UPI003A8CC7E3
MLILRRAVIVFVGYFLLAEFGRLLAIPPAYTSPVWPAAGLGVFYLLMWGWRYWPMIWLGSVASDVLHRFVLAEHDLELTVLTMTAVDGVGASLSAIVGACAMVALVADKKRVISERRVFKAILIAVPVAGAIAPTLSLGTLYLLSRIPVESIAGSWIYWWMGDSLGVMLLAPLMLPLTSRSLSHLGFNKHIRQLQIVPLLVIVVLILAFHALGRIEKLDFQQRHEARSEVLQDNLRQTLFALSETVKATGDFIISSQQVDLGEFRRFTQRSLDSGLVKEIGWTPSVSGAQGDGYRALISGFDRGIENEYSERLEYAISNRQSIFINQRLLNGSNIDREDAWHYVLPVYNSELTPALDSQSERKKAFIGFVSGLIYFDDVTTLFSERLAASGVHFRLTLSSLDEEETVLLSDNRTDINKESAPDWSNDYEYIGDKKIKLETWPSSPWQAGQSANMKAYAVSATLLAFFVTFYVIYIAKQNAHIARRIKRRTKMLNDSRREFSEILDNMTSYIVELDSSGRINWLNNTVKDAYHLSIAEVVGKSFVSSPWLRDLPQEQTWLSDDLNVALLGTNVRRDLELRRMNGDIFSLDLNIIPVFDDAYNVRKLIVAAHDITERKIAEKKLEQNEKVLNRIVDGSELGYWDWNVVTNKLVVKGSYASMLGYKLEQFTCIDDWITLIHPEDKGEVLQQLESHLQRHNDNYMAEYRVLSSSGEWHWIRARGKVSQYDDERAPITMSGVHVDVHQEKLIAVELHKKEALLLELNQSLEEKVDRRTQELQQLTEQLEDRVVERTAELQESRLEAEKANQAKSYFLATMSHEIRTPLNGVVGMIDVLAQTELSHRQHEMLELINYSAISLSELIDSILEFSKIEAGKIEVEHQVFSIRDIIEKTCDMLDYQAVKEGVELTLFIDPLLPDNLIGDDFRVRQIIINLVNNAIKFSSGRKPGKVRVGVMLASKNDRELSASFTVSDNGVGINEKAQKTIFNAFTQADVSTTRNFGGTGLGLAITSRLVQLLGGSISLQSEEACGACFTVQLPFAQDEMASKDTSLVSPINGVPCLVIGGIDDISDDLLCYLRHEGAQVNYVSDLEAAIQASDLYAPGLCIWIYDAIEQGFSVEGLREAARLWPQHQIRFVILERGRRRSPRRVDEDHVVMDANVLKRDVFVQAVAGAAGVVPIPEKTAILDVKYSNEKLPDVVGNEASILIAEDNVVNQKVINKQLSLLGYQAEIVSNGQQALHLLREKNYDLLITDLSMPEMDGYQLTRFVRSELGLNKDIPIIAISANAFKEEKERCLELGMNDYLTKPLELNKFHAVISRWLSNQLPEQSSGDISVSLDSALQKSHQSVDINIFKSLIGDDEALLHELLGEYLRTINEQSKLILDAWESKDNRRLADIAHSLKSSSRSIGAIRLGALCEEMESLCNHTQGGVASRLIELFKMEVDAVIDFVEKTVG